MSGIGQGPNKFATCKGCPDRTIEPNCHTVCRGYLYRAERAKKIREAKQTDIYWGYRHEQFEDKQI